MNRWNRPGIPHKDWQRGDELDLKEEGYSEQPYATCDMCGRTGVRWLHLMTHRDYVGVLAVGRFCAEKMVVPSKKRAAGRVASSAGGDGGVGLENLGQDS